MRPLLSLEAQLAYGTEVPNVRKAHLYLLTGIQANTHAILEVNAEARKMQKSWNLWHQMETIGIASSRHSPYRRQIVDRTFAILGVTVVGFSLAVGGSGLAQTKSGKKAAPAGKDAAAAARGQQIFQQKCSSCHYD